MINHHLPAQTYRRGDYRITVCLITKNSQVKLSSQLVRYRYSDNKLTIGR